MTDTGRRGHDDSRILSHRIWNKLPASLFALTGVFDTVAWWTGDRDWHLFGLYAVGAGATFALLAGILGVRDWIRIPNGRRAKTLAFHHGWLMLATVMVWATIGILRIDGPRDVSKGEAGLLVCGLGLLAYGALRGRGVLRSLEGSKR